jgi:Protein of unknown function (DUF1460)
MERARKGGWTGRPIGEVLALVGEGFLGSPYVAHTLEAEGPERLVVNLREFDCTTLFESALALARCVKIPGSVFTDFEAHLRFIRYRSGAIDGYPSRLHYFTDWLADNARKGTVRDLTRDLGGTARTRRLSFMSEHPSSYRQLSDSAFLDSIRTRERTLNEMKRSHIPRAHVRDVEGSLQDGDIIGITTTIKGLDVSHTGLIVRQSGRAAFLHASSAAKRVELAEGTISSYLERYRTHDGIMVARPREPEPNDHDDQL